MIGAMKATTVRLDEETLETLDVVARVLGRSVNALINEAIAEELARRRADPAFVERLRKAVERDKAVLAGIEATGPAPVTPRCQHVEVTPWGASQCALPEHDPEVERHAYSPSEAIEDAEGEKPHDV